MNRSDSTILIILVAVIAFVYLFKQQQQTVSVAGSSNPLGDNSTSLPLKKVTTTNPATTQPATNSVLDQLKKLLSPNSSNQQQQSGQKQSSGGSGGGSGSGAGGGSGSGSNNNKPSSGTQNVVDRDGTTKVGDTLYDKNGNKIGTDTDFNFWINNKNELIDDTTGLKIGEVTSKDGSFQIGDDVFDKNGNYLGWDNGNGTWTDNKTGEIIDDNSGETRGYNYGENGFELDGSVYGADGTYQGEATDFGYWIGTDGQLHSDANGDIIGEQVDPDGTVQIGDEIYQNGVLIGIDNGDGTWTEYATGATIDDNSGFLVNEDGTQTDDSGYVWNKDGDIIGLDNGDGTMTDLFGNEIDQSTGYPIDYSEENEDNSSYPQDNTKYNDYYSIYDDPSNIDPFPEYDYNPDDWG